MEDDEHPDTFEERISFYNDIDGVGWWPRNYSSETIVKSFKNLYLIASSVL